MKGWWNGEMSEETSTFTWLLWASEHSHCDSESEEGKRYLSGPFLFFFFFLVLYNNTALSISTTGVVAKTFSCPCLSSCELYKHSCMYVAHNEGYNLSPMQRELSHRCDMTACMVDYGSYKLSNNGHPRWYPAVHTHTYICTAVIITPGPVVIILWSH